MNLHYITVPVSFVLLLLKIHFDKRAHIQTQKPTPVTQKWQRSGYVKLPFLKPQLASQTQQENTVY